MKLTIIHDDDDLDNECKEWREKKNPASNIDVESFVLFAMSTNTRSENNKEEEEEEIEVEKRENAGEEEGKHSAKSFNSFNVDTVGNFRFFCSNRTTTMINAEKTTKLSAYDKLRINEICAIIIPRHFVMWIFR